MATPAKLKRFEVSGSGMEFTLHIEDDSGHSLELSASRDQLDVIADALDDVLLLDDSGDEVEQ
jgi:hypothetical protein